MSRICVVKDTHTGDQSHGHATANREFDLIGYATQALAENALLAYSQASLVHDILPTLLRDKWTVDEIESNPGEWNATVSWKRWVPDTIGDEELSGSVGVQTVKLNYAHNHIGDYAPAGVNPIKSYGALGLKLAEDGSVSVEGWDIEFPVVTFTIRKTYVKGYGTITRTIVLNDYAGKPNSVGWRGFGPQTVKLTGAEVANHDEDEDIVTYTFAASPTVLNIAIPTPSGNILIPQKLGWQLLTVTSIPEPQNGASESGFTVEVPHSAHVDELTPTIDYNAILP